MLSFWQRHVAHKARILFLGALCAGFSSCARTNRDAIGSERARSQKMPAVFIDAGHGGHDPGAQVAQVKEKDLALACALRIATVLRARGYRVQMSRSSDQFIPLTGRVQMAERAGSALFVSIHFNSAPNVRAHGVELFYYQDAKRPRRLGASEQLGSCILNSVASAGIQTRGVHAGNFCVIRETSMPAVLVEGGFLTNRQERRLLTDMRYLQRLADAVAQGIDAYVRQGRD